MNPLAIHPRARAPGLSGVVKSLGAHTTTARIGIIHTPFVGTRSPTTCIEKVCRAGPEDERMAELNKREAELWDRQVELYTSMSKNASTMYEGLQEVYNELREFHMAEKKMWLEREESLAKENQELRNTLMYVMSRMRSLEASDDSWIDGTAASGGIPEQASMDEEDVRPSSSIQDDFAAAFAAVENGDILKDDPLSFKGRVEDASVLDNEDVSDAETPVVPTGPPPTLTMGDDDIYWVNQLHVALVDAGFYPGDEDIDDFIFGESTQSALLTFQACSGIPESGMADMATWVELLGEDLEHKKSRDLTEDMNPLTESKATETTKPQKPFAELFSSETIQVNVTHGSITSSVKETHSHDEKIFKDGHIEVEDTDSVELQEKVSTRTEWPVLLEGDGGKEVHALHVLLENAGYWPGEDDLQWWQYGDSTVAAIKTCQACNGLPESGACDETMWQLLLGQNASPSDIDSIQSGNSDDEDLAVDGTDTRVWLIGEQRWEDRSRVIE